MKAYDKMTAPCLSSNCKMLPFRPIKTGFTWNLFLFILVTFRASQEHPGATSLRSRFPDFPSLLVRPDTDLPNPGSIFSRLCPPSTSLTASSQFQELPSFNERHIFPSTSPSRIHELCLQSFRKPTQWHWITHVIWRQVPYRIHNGLIDATITKIYKFCPVLLCEPATYGPQEGKFISSPG